MKHYTVLKKESIEGLNIKSDGTYVDATLGYAGDASEILKRIKRGKLFAFDRDETAVCYSKEVLSEIGDNFEIFSTRYSNMKKCLESVGVTKVDGILFDLGVSSPQLDEERGFSFMREEDLDMRMDVRDTKTAYDVWVKIRFPSKSYKSKRKTNQNNLRTCGYHKGCCRSKLFL